MAAYFDIASSACINLLPDSIACRSDLAFLATEAEADVIQHYKREQPDTRGTALDDSRAVVTGYENLYETSSDPVVYLRYYKADADELTSTDELLFKAAMRRAIAALMRLRATQEDMDMSVRSESRGRRSVEYWSGINPLGGTLPRSVTKWLKPYDKRPATYAI